MKPQTREQLILGKLVAVTKEIKDGKDWEALESRAEALPAMLLRHGALPVKLFLQSKGDTDKKLWAYVEKGMLAVLEGVNVSAEELAKLPFEQYLLVNEVAVEVSTLLARWIKVHTSEERSKGVA